MEFIAETATKSGGEGTNEDRVGSSEYSAWVIDGATGLTDRELTDAASDGVWYVDEFERELRQRIDDTDRSIDEIVAEIVDIVDRRFRAAIDGEISDPLLEPSAAVAIVRYNDGTFEHFVLGDCTVIFQDTSGDVDVIKGEGPRALDSKAIDRIEELVNNGYSHSEAFSRLIPQLRDHRRRKNTPGGYWTLGFSTEAVSHAVTGKRDADEWLRAYLFTDGFEVIGSTYDVFEGWREVTEYVDSNGLDRALRLIRDIERGDPECRRYPRMKPSDDASIAKVGRR